MAVIINLTEDECNYLWLDVRGNKYHCLLANIQNGLIVE